jgi:hypothetical protein
MVLGTFATATQQPAHAGGRGAARGAQTPTLARSTVEFRARNPDEALRQLTQAKDVADAQGIALRTSMDQVVSARLGRTCAANNTASPRNRPMSACCTLGMALCDALLTLWCAHVADRSTQ